MGAPEARIDRASVHAGAVVQVGVGDFAPFLFPVVADGDAKGTKGRGVAFHAEVRGTGLDELSVNGGQSVAVIGRSHLLSIRQVRVYPEPVEAERPDSARDAI